MDPEDEQLNPLKQWRACAPQVPPLASGKKWHVFRSYRPFHRDWALHLYDALSPAGFGVFLDQFQLVAGATLASSLAQALSESASGVIVWPSEAADSQGCQREYDTMLTMQTRPGSTFQFVVVKTDTHNLPLCSLLAPTSSEAGGQDRLTPGMAQF